MFIENLLVITAATEETDGFNRFMRTVTEFNYTVKVIHTHTNTSRAKCTALLTDCVGWIYCKLHSMLMGLMENTVLRSHLFLPLCESKADPSVLSINDCTER